jgi:hypothetical protein
VKKLEEDQTNQLVQANEKEAHGNKNSRRRQRCKYPFNWYPHVSIGIYTYVFFTNDI